MKSLELAHRYMDIVFSTNEWNNLKDILAKNLRFRGPLFEFDSAEAYIKSMMSNPPEQFQYKIEKEYEDASSACLIYKFNKPGISVMMTQMFVTNDNKITHIELIFDSVAFRKTQ